MKRSAENLNEARLAGWAVSVGCERGLAGESGVASRSAGFATAVQNALVAAAAIGESKCGLHWLGDGGRKTWMEIN